MEHKTLPIFNASVFGFRWTLDKFSLFFQILLVYIAVLLGVFLLGTFLWVAVKDSEYRVLFGLILSLISAFILLVDEFDTIILEREVNIK